MVFGADMARHINLSNHFKLIWKLSPWRWRLVSLLWPCLNVTASPKVSTDSPAKRELSRTHLFPPRGELKQSFSILSLFCVGLSLWPPPPTTTMVAEKQSSTGDPLFYCFIAYNNQEVETPYLHFIEPNWTLSDLSIMWSARHNIGCVFFCVSWEVGIDWMSPWLESNLA